MIKFSEHWDLQAMVFRKESPNLLLVLNNFIILFSDDLYQILVVKIAI